MDRQTDGRIYAASTVLVAMKGECQAGELRGHHKSKNYDV
jgi:hypothetical protein